jgi:hypothetical protein
MDAVAPYLPKELGGTVGQPGPKLDDAVHQVFAPIFVLHFRSRIPYYRLQVLRQELSTRFASIFTESSSAEGKCLSKQDRMTLGLSKSSLTYGEISFDALASVLYAHVDLPPGGGVFVDLGSGNGRGVIAACMMHKFYRAVGIELLPSLHAAAVSAGQRYQALLNPAAGTLTQAATLESSRSRVSSAGSDEEQPEPEMEINESGFLPSCSTPRHLCVKRQKAVAKQQAKDAAEDAAEPSLYGTDSTTETDVDNETADSNVSPIVFDDRISARRYLDPATMSPPVVHSEPTTPTDIQFICADFLSADWWSAADVVFANSTCFDDALMRAIGQRAQRLKQGAYVITLTKPLHSHDFQRVYQGQCQMAWGVSNIYVARKLTDPSVDA